MKNLHSDVYPVKYDKVYRAEQEWKAGQIRMAQELINEDNTESEKVRIPYRTIVIGAVIGLVMFIVFNASLVSASPIITPLSVTVTDRTPSHEMIRGGASLETITYSPLTMTQRYYEDNAF